MAQDIAELIRIGDLLSQINLKLDRIVNHLEHPPVEITCDGSVIQPTLMGFEPESREKTHQEGAKSDEQGPLDTSDIGA